MSINILHSKSFNNIVHCDVEHTNFATDESEKKIVQLTQRVIKHLASSELQKDEVAQLSQFIEKIEQIDKQLNESGRNTVLNTCAYTLKVLTGLRTDLDSSHQEIAHQEFIIYLTIIKDFDKLEDPLDTMVNLVDFLNDQLLPALKSAKNLQELHALEPLVNECIELCGRLMKEPVLGEAAKNIELYQRELINLWDARHLQTQNSYQRLLTYKKGQLGDLSDPRIREQRKAKIEEIVEAFKKNINRPELTREEKIAIFRAIQIIKAEFAEQGVEVKFAITKTFHSFLINDLLPAVEKAKSLDEVMALHPILERCTELAQKYKHRQIDDALKTVIRASMAKIASFESIAKPAEVLPTSKNDRAVIQRLSKEIIDLKPTIGDADAYPFSALHGKYINEAKTKSGSIAMLAAALRASSSKKRYSESPDEILRLGQDLLKDKSGMCDHMAAAVIAKIVEHIRSGGQWDADVEIVGNGAHAFVVINRPLGALYNLDNWKGAIIIDTWLGAVGVNPKYQDRIPSPQNGVISDPKEVRMFATAFGALDNSMTTQRRFNPQELRSLAQKR